MPKGVKVQVLSSPPICFFFVRNLRDPTYKIVAAHAMIIYSYKTNGSNKGT